MTLATMQQIERAEALELERLVNRGQEARREREALMAAQVVALASMEALKQERARRIAAERLFKKGTCGIACVGFGILMGFAGAWPLAILAAMGAGWSIAG